MKVKMGNQTANILRKSKHSEFGGGSGIFAAHAGFLRTGTFLKVNGCRVHAIVSLRCIIMYKTTSVTAQLCWSYVVQKNHISRKHDHTTPGRQASFHFTQVMSALRKHSGTQPMSHIVRWRQQLSRLRETCNACWPSADRGTLSFSSIGRFLMSDVHRCWLDMCLCAGRCPISVKRARRELVAKLKADVRNEATRGERLAITLLK